MNSTKSAWKLKGSLIVMPCLISYYINMNDLQTIDTPELTAQELTFSHLIAKGLSLTQAYKNAYPEKCKGKSAYTIRKYASNLYTNRNIVTEVATYQARTAHLARIAEDRIEQILIEDSSTAKGNKVADVAMFMYEQANGKATQKVVTEGKHIVVTYDLSGGKGGEVPQEILDQLKEE